MNKKISQKIVSYKVSYRRAEARGQCKRGRVNIIQMHEKVSRPEELAGSTYKIKTPMSDHALYLTINDIILNQGTDHELRRPFEVFINSKNMDHFQWIVALTRVLSAVFRKGGDCTFLVEEMKAVFDPTGWLFQARWQIYALASGRDWMGNRRSLQKIGMLKKPEISDHQQQIMNEKRAEFEGAAAAPVGEVSDFPPTAEVCKKCSVKAVILMDGCMTCLNCGDSKCG